MKQQNFANIAGIIPKIAVPAIKDTFVQDGLVTMKMDYVPHKDIIQFLINATVYEINSFIDLIKKFINHCLRFCTDEIIGSEVISTKYFTCNTNYTFPNIPPFIKLPVGICHGDLSLSNILLNEITKDVTIIDFLDSFIESPLVDMVKIRQDTKWLWSLELYKHKLHESEYNRVKISLSYLDEMFVKFFEDFPFYRQYYELFEHLNLVRILPYVEGDIRNYIERILKEELCRH